MNECVYGTFVREKPKETVLASGSQREQCERGLEGDAATRRY